MKFLQAFASQTEDGKPSLTVSVLKLGAEDYSIKSQTYTIPAKSSDLKNSADFFFNDPEPILNITKQRYNEEIVFHFMNLDKQSVDYDKINKSYGVILSQVSNSETIFDQILNDTSVNLEQEAANLEAQQKKDVEEYEKTITPEFKEKLQEGIDSDDDHDDEDFDEGPEDNIILSYEQIKNTNQSNLESNLQLAGNRLGDIGYSQEQISLGSALNTSKASPGSPAGSVTGGTTADIPATRRPKSLNQSPAYDLGGLSIGQASKLGSAKEIKDSYYNGVGGGRLIEPVPLLSDRPGDSILQSENNSGIIATRDEFYKVRGHTKAGAAYMFAGRSPDNIEMEIEDPNDPDGPPIKVTKPNDLVKDAAYVYLSQKSDVDNLLKVAGGTYSKAISKVKSFSPTETRQGLSLAAIKADDVTIMSRVSGIRLITGTDNQNSRGGDNSSKFGIDLIAGNEDQDLQPLVKGDNLKKYLEGLSKSLGEVTGILADFINAQIKFNTAVAAHTHYDPFTILLGFMSTNGANPAAINGAKGYVSPEVVDAGRNASLNNIIQLFGSKAAGQNRVNNDTSAFNNIGAWKILSDKNRTN